MILLDLDQPIPEGFEVGFRVEIHEDEVVVHGDIPLRDIGEGGPQVGVGRSVEDGGSRPGGEQDRVAGPPLEGRPEDGARLALEPGGEGAVDLRSGSGNVARVDEDRRIDPR